MKFDPELSEVFTTEGVTFEFNHARTEYLSNDILDQYNTQMNNLGKIFKKAKKKNKSNKAEDIIALHSEWNVNDNNETLYLVFNDDDNSFTHVTTENLFYSETNEVQE
jgi:ABC-type enterochelin transport system substrate-binding protein